MDSSPPVSSSDERWDYPLTIREGIILSAFGMLLFLFIWREITRCCHGKKTVIINERRVPERRPQLYEMAPMAMAAPMPESKLSTTNVSNSKPTIPKLNPPDVEMPNI